MKGTSTGKADVYLDDVFVKTVDLANPVAVYPAKGMVNRRSDLPALHKVKISWYAGQCCRPST